MWLIIIASVLSATFLGALYMTICIGRFGAIKKISGDKKWLRNLLSFIVMAAIFTVLAFALSAVNAVVIFLNAVLFFLFFGLIMRIVNRKKDKPSSVNWQGWLALISLTAYLSVGYYLCFHIWQKDYNIKTDKNIQLKITLFADSHMGTTFDGEGFAKQLKRIEEQSPDIILIAGDFVDDSTNKNDLVTACEALQNTTAKYGVWYCYGNHDKGYYNSRDFSANELEETMKEHGIHVLSDEYELVDDSFYIVGRKDKSDQERKPAKELLKDVDESKYIILLDHQPGDYDNEAATAADLVLSGHTHGGQLFPITYVGEWFNINDRTYGHEKRNGTDFIVTSGISDWELAFKTGAKSEYVIINVSN